MLYDCWLQVAQATPERIAIHDVATARSWTFRELAAEAKASDHQGEGIVFAEGLSVDFIVAVLRAWRLGRVCCPLEPGQLHPSLAGAFPEGVIHLKTTSATTGESRLVCFTEAQLLADVENISNTMGLRPDRPNLAVISLAHSYGFSNLVLPLLLHGIPLILAGTALPEAVRRAAAVEPAITLAAVPALWQAWHEAGAIPRNVELAISAGAPLPISLERAVFRNYCLKIHNFYGSSECGGIAFDSTTTPRLDPAMVGSLLRNVNVSVGGDGCLEVRSLAVGQTYWPKPDSSLADGVFRTNDLGEISEGVIHLRGRNSDQINVAGRKISPEVIERALSEHPKVRQCLAFGVPSQDAQRGETIVACVAADGELNGESLKQFVLSKLPAWQVPREWWFVQGLELNARGKVPRADWRKRYLEHAKKL